jgi:hypothetical protein
MYRLVGSLFHSSYAVAFILSSADCEEPRGERDAVPGRSLPFRDLEMKKQFDELRSRANRVGLELDRRPNGYALYLHRGERSYFVLFGATSDEVEAALKGGSMRVPRYVKGC